MKFQRQEKRGETIHFRTNDFKELFFPIQKEEEEEGIPYQNRSVLIQFVFFVVELCL